MCWLELDLLLEGTWTSKNVPKLEVDKLDQFEDFVNMETMNIIDINNSIMLLSKNIIILLIMLRFDVNNALNKCNGAGIVDHIQDWARLSPLGKADPDRYKAVKTEAVLI
jgi:hypothetical protein